MKRTRLLASITLVLAVTAATRPAAAADPAATQTELVRQTQELYDAVSSGSAKGAASTLAWGNAPGDLAR